MPVIKTADGLAAKFLRDGIEQDVRRRPVAVDARLVDENRHVAVLHPPDLDVAIAGANQGAAGEKQIAGLGFFHFQRGGFVQALARTSG